MNTYRNLVIWALVVATLISLSAMYQKFLWNECRLVGHSWGYCVGVIVR